MTRRPLATDARRPRTVYLSDELWDALERLYVEERMRRPGEASKIAVVEQVVRLGIAEWRRRHAPAVLPAEPQAPTPARTGRTTSKAARARQPRVSPVQRLLLASDPGRAPDIPSVAEPD
jgi:hypothetical protein